MTKILMRLVFPVVIGLCIFVCNTTDSSGSDCGCWVNQYRITEVPLSGLNTSWQNCAEWEECCCPAPSTECCECITITDLTDRNDPVKTVVRVDYRIWYCDNPKREDHDYNLDCGETYPAYKFFKKYNDSGFNVDGEVLLDCPLCTGVPIEDECEARWLEEFNDELNNGQGFGTAFWSTSQTPPCSC